MNVPIEWIDYARALGLPSLTAVALYYIVPKLWSYFQQRQSVHEQQNDLARVGLAGVNEVVSTMRNQLADMTSQLENMRTRLKEIEAQLKKANDDRLEAEQSEAIAKNELFNARLYIKKLIAQIRSLGAAPVDE